jgi:S-adenosyl methyltransferase
MWTPISATPGNIIVQAAGTLDFAEPIVVLLIATMHFIPDEDDPWEIVHRLMAEVPSGSYLVMSHAAPENLKDADSKGRLNTVYAKTASGGVIPRPLPQVREFFAGLELADPGVADVAAWRPVVHEAGNHPGETLFYGGAARKRHRKVPPAGHRRQPFVRTDRPVSPASADSGC